jgi:hypothetical protein
VSDGPKSLRSQGNVKFDCPRTTPEAKRKNLKISPEGRRFRLIVRTIKPLTKPVLVCRGKDVFTLRAGDW